MKQNFPKILNKNKLHLGCGKIYLDGFVNADIGRGIKVDISFDADKKFPFPDNRFEFILCNYMLQDVKDLVFTFNEMLRVSKNDAIIEIKVPFNNYETWSDPMAKREFSEHTFDSWDLKTNLGKDVAHETGNSNKINIIKVKKKRGKYNWFRVHGLHFIFQVKKSIHH